MSPAQVERVLDTFPHLADHRSFTSWAPHFESFAQAFIHYGLPISNLIAFIDGKLWPICRPGMYQNIMYSGHKRIHGLKVQGLVFPNGARRHGRFARSTVQNPSFSSLSTPSSP